MKKSIILIFAASFLIIIGCTVKPTPQQLESADFGPYPTNYEEIIKAYFQNRLLDPYSAVFTFNDPLKTRIIGGKSGFGWIVCGTINAKNRFGGYVGAQYFYVSIYNGKVEDDAQELSAEGTCRAFYK